MSDLHPAHRDHSRHFRANRYVYAVLSRRAGGISIGVNLSPHKGCNFDCTYCQVDRTTPPTERTVDVDTLRLELRVAFTLARTGELLDDPRFAGAPEEHLRVADVALSGDGEPTNEPWFAQAARVVAEERTSAGLLDLPYRIITNATTFHLPRVAETLRHLDAHGLDVWGKLDAGTAAYYRMVDRTRVPFDRVLGNLAECARQREITIQTLFARHRGDPPPAEEIDAWAGRLRDIIAAGGRIGWVQVHTVSRPPAEAFVTPLSPEELEAVAEAARQACPGLRVDTYRGAS